VIKPAELVGAKSAEYQLKLSDEVCQFEVELQLPELKERK
jgi:hypothetical protein